MPNSVKFHSFVIWRQIVSYAENRYKIQKRCRSQKFRDQSGRGPMVAAWLY